MLKKDRIISYRGEFKDKELEREYFNFEISNALTFIKPVMLALGILYLLFIIPDYFLITNAKTFRNILLNRIGFVILIVLFYSRLKYFKDFWVFSYWVTIYELICVFCFLHIFFQYEQPDFLIQSFGIIIIMLAVFLVPNRWVNKVAVSIFISIAFFTLSLFIFQPIITSEFSAAVVYTFIAIFLNAIASWQTSYYRRIQYVNGKELIKLSITDSLISTFNRLKFDEELIKWFNYANRYNTDLSLILFDIDNFKKINDQLGHLVGDKVLIELSHLVKRQIRETDIFARWGGEEFAILLPNTHNKMAIEVAKKIRLAIESFSFNTVGRVTCSFGVTSLGSDDDLKSFINHVDQLLYQAKQMGKNIVQSDIVL